jgi:glycosyltransferase involved in cell wall biosynthesis
MPRSTASIAWKPCGNLDTASSRLRAFLPCHYLQKHGWSCEIFNPKNVDSYDLVIFQKAYEEEDLQLANRLKQCKKKVIFDLCDNHFAYSKSDPSHSNRIARLSAIINIADTVSVSTVELSKLIEHHSVKVIDDAIDIPPIKFKDQSIYKLKEVLSGKSRTLKIVWFGNSGLEDPPFGLIDLVNVIPFLETLTQDYSISLSIISNSKDLADHYVGKPTFPVFYYRWKYESFASIFSLHDICILPINLNPFTICKTNNRVVLSLMLGVPVIADKIPSYSEFENFVMFSDWKNNLMRYALDSELRKQHILQGQKYIKKKYTQEHSVKQWSSLFESVL